MKFNLTKPCGKACPFVNDTTMVLMPGRMEEITKGLRNDLTVFICHKTRAQHFEGEQACMGALAYTFRNYGMLPVMARLAISMGDLKIENIERHAGSVLPKGQWPILQSTSNSRKKR